MKVVTVLYIFVNVVMQLFAGLVRITSLKIEMDRNSDAHGVEVKSILILSQEICQMKNKVRLGINAIQLRIETYVICCVRGGVIQ
jgi:hypothetical protein